MKFLRYFLVFIALTVVQTTLCRLIAVKGVQPDLILIFIVYLSMKEGAMAGILCGFLAGLFFDVYSPQHLGAGSLAKSIVGYLSGLLDERNITLDDKYKMLVLFIAALFHDTVTASFAYGPAAAFKTILVFQSLPAALYTAFVGGIFFLAASRRK
jgi:rod shape-determining protein MreD